MTTPRDVLDFWFGREADPDYGHYRPVWFAPDKEFIAQARERFAETYRGAATGELDSWQQSPEGSLALVLLLDQFSNLIHRGGPELLPAMKPRVKLLKMPLSAASTRNFPNCIDGSFIFRSNTAKTSTTSMRRLNYSAP